jgi:signal transduction histidine kinase
VSARHVVDNAVGFAELDASKHGIAIVTDVAHDLPPLDADPILIEQVLLNLLKNAIDAMENAEVRRIDVRVRRPAAEPIAEFRVVDRGSGIGAEQTAEIFQPFFSTKPDGMGMGLNICRSIVEFHRGRLGVEPNPEPAGGTIFRFTLPLAIGTAPASDAPAAQETTEK